MTLQVYSSWRTENSMCNSWQTSVEEHPGSVEFSNPKQSEDVAASTRDLHTPGGDGA